MVKITAGGIAQEALERLAPLYAIEERIRDYSPHSRKRIRQKQSLPILKGFYRWLKTVKSQVPPKSALGNAIGYTLNQWPYLIAYARHGIAEIDTNLVENQIRPIALGRRNWLFMGDEDSGQVHAIFYSLVLSCILNNLNPRLYIHYLLSKIHDIRRGKIDPGLLLPHNIAKTQLESFAHDFIQQSKKILDRGSPTLDSS